MRRLEPHLEKTREEEHLPVVNHPLQEQLPVPQQGHPPPPLSERWAKLCHLVAKGHRLTERPLLEDAQDGQLSGPE